MTIKNLVIGTAGIHIFELVGALHKLLRVNYIKYDEIDNIYCTSAGSIMGVLFCLKPDIQSFFHYCLVRILRLFLKLNMTQMNWQKKHKLNQS